MGQVISFAIVFGLSLAIAAGVAAVCHLVLRFALNREAKKPRAFAVTCIWLIGIVATDAYWAYTGWFSGHYQNQFNTLTTQAWNDAKEIAKSKGELVPADPPFSPTAKLNPPPYQPPEGPIFWAEYGERYTKAEQAMAPAANWDIKSDAAEWALLLLWVVCGLAVAVYYVRVLRKSSKWVKAISLAFAFATAQWVVIGILASIAALWLHLACGGSLENAELPTNYPEVRRL